MWQNTSIGNEKKIPQNPTLLRCFPQRQNVHNSPLADETLKIACSLAACASVCRILGSLFVFFFFRISCESSAPHTTGKESTKEGKHAVGYLSTLNESRPAQPRELYLQFYMYCRYCGIEMNVLSLFFRLPLSRHMPGANSNEAKKIKWKRRNQARRRTKAIDFECIVAGCSKIHFILFTSLPSCSHSARLCGSNGNLCVLARRNAR